MEFDGLDDASGLNDDDDDGRFGRECMKGRKLMRHKKRRNVLETCMLIGNRAMKINVLDRSLVCICHSHHGSGGSFVFKRQITDSIVVGEKTPHVSLRKSI